MTNEEIKSYLKNKANEAWEKEQKVKIPKMTDKEREAYKIGLILGKWAAYDEAYTEIYDEEY